MAGLTSDLSLDTEQNKVFMDNVKLAYHFSQKFYATIYNSDGEFILEKDDIDNVCLVGLVKAVKNFNPELGLKFSTFASTCMRNEFLQLFKKNTHRTELLLEDTKEFALKDVKNHEDNSNKNIYEMLADSSTSIDYVVGVKEQNLDKSIIVLKAYNKMVEGNSKRVISCYLQNPDFKLKEIAGIVGVSRASVSKVLIKFRNRINREYTRKSA